MTRLQSAEASLLLVTAPAGYGKTTLLLQYARRDPRPLGWLRLDQADNDPALLVDRLWDALAAVALQEPEVLQALFEGDRVALPAMSRIMAELRGPFTLVIDDVDALTEPPALGVLAALAMSIPSGSRLVLGSRTTPEIGIGGLRALGRVLEISTADLAFTGPEATALMRKELAALRDVDVEDLVTSTEGWATGLYLAALTLGANRVAGSGFSGDDPLVTDYFFDEVLRMLPEPTVEFLIRSSVLRHLMGTTCDAVLGRNGSGALLRKLHRSNLFIGPLDRHQRTYRLHRLFRQALSAELHRRDPGLEAELHRRASNWYESQGNADESIRHAIRAGDVHRASRLIWAEISPISSPPGQILKGWLSAFSERELAAHAPLALAMAWWHARRADGDGTDKWVSVAERSYYRGGLPGGPGTLAAAVSLLRAWLGREGVARMTRDASRAYELDSDHGPWRGVARYLQGMGLRLLGNREAAAPILEESARHCRWSVPATRAECLAQLALIASERGDGARCYVLAQQVSELTEELQLRGESAPAIAFAVSALVHAQQGDHVAARSNLHDAADALSRYSNFAPWLEAECRIVMGRANLALSDVGAARSLLAEARLVLRETPDAALLDNWMEETIRAIEEFPVPSKNGGASLTAAELRVLHMLPTHLSFPEVGAQLFLSRNTVKSQAISVYRKLGVASRADAVRRARALGMLEGAVDDLAGTLENS
ncbi:MAG: LuxR C-terminal-related transcriptional regulator [Actinomycetota bacterium]